ncbi:hypothetical protein ACHAXA_001672 [Cyclostephanos tholiformis]|uniref:DUF1995 domain-containing protein n=1 Tax=Cyclostephanos tholiformis TaxID=382380 RepID=A0ABD3RSA7_9STRA
MPSLVSIMPWLAIALEALPTSSSSFRDARVAFATRSTTTSTTTSAPLALRPPPVLPVASSARPGRRHRRPSRHDAFPPPTVDAVGRRRDHRGRYRRGGPPRRRGTSSSYIPGRSSLTAVIDDDADDDDYDWDDDDDVNDDDSRRLSSMRSMLESSWDASLMGDVPSDPHSAARAAVECVSNAMSCGHNVVTVDIRLPTYDILEGRRAYDIMAVYDFCVELSIEMRFRGLSRRCLLLARNGGEVNEIERVLESRRRRGGGVVRGDGTTTSTTSTTVRRRRRDLPGDVDRASEFDDSLMDRRRLMSSWESTGDGGGGDSSSTTKSSEDDNGRRAIPSHRLWSTVGNDLDDIAPGPDAFDRIVSATDANARLGHEEDALVILSPYDTTDVIALRRILARYGRSRTILIVNSRFEVEPMEMRDAVLAYGMLPLVAAVRGDNKVNHGSGRRRGVDGSDAGGGGGGGGGGVGGGLRAVVMKRFPRDWTVYVDVHGDGFVEVEGGMLEGVRRGGGGGGLERGFPSPEWIALRVQAHVEGLSRPRDAP